MNVIKRNKVLFRFILSIYKIWNIGVNPDTEKLADECYPDAASKAD